MYDEERPTTLSHHAKARNYLVHIGFQLSRNCIRQYRYFFRMACVLANLCNFLNGSFQCQLLEDTIDVEVTVRTMKGIHTIKRAHTTQVISCRPWSSQLCPFSSLVKMMKACIEDEESNADPFLPTPTYPDRPTILPPTKPQAPQKRKARDVKKRKQETPSQ